MDDKGKFKKPMIIIMLVAVFISVCSLAWVVIFKGDDEYQETNKDFYEETMYIEKAEAANTDSDSDANINIEITVPVSFVLEDINATSKLTKEQQNMGFKSATYDGDNSVTYVISKADYKDFLLSYRFEVVDNLESAFRQSYPYFRSLDYNDDLSLLTMKVDRSTFNSSDGEAISTTVLLPSMIYQMYAKTDTHCQVTITDNETNQVITTYTP